MPRPTDHLLAAVLLAAAGPAGAQDSEAGIPPAAAPAPPAISEPTPVKDRVLVIGVLAKRTGQTRSFTLKPNQFVRFAGLRITARTCETTPPWERPKLSGAFLQVDEKLGDAPEKRVFSGWLFAESPSLNVMEHPRYDVWLKSCTMRFPDRAPSASTAKKSPEPASAATN